MTKELILSAATVAFSKFGYKKTTLNDIASQINMEKTAIYYYYKNKDEIFKEVIIKEAEKLKSALLIAIAEENEPVEKFKKYVITRMILLKDISNYYNALKHELYDSLQFINQNRVAFDNAETLIIMDILTDGVKKGFFEITDLQGTTLVIISILKGLEIPFFGNEETFDYNTPLTLLLNILLNGLVKKL